MISMIKKLVGKSDCSMRVAGYYGFLFSESEKLDVLDLFFDILREERMQPDFSYHVISYPEDGVSVQRLLDTVDEFLEIGVLPQ